MKEKNQEAEMKKQGAEMKNNGYLFKVKWSEKTSLCG